MDMIGKIRRLSRRGKKSEREIARLTGLSRNTVAKWLHGESEGEPKYRRGGQPNKLTAFHAVLLQALKADARRFPVRGARRPGRPGRPARTSVKPRVRRASANGERRAARAKRRPPASQALRVFQRDVQV